MTAVHDALTADPGLEVRLLTSPGVLCEACPHLGEAQGCNLQGPDHEAHMRRHDEQVLDALEVSPGDVLPWGEIVGRVARAIRGRDLAALCTSCPWLPHGWCEAALDALHVDGPSPGPSGS
jgi:hypothetical protein